ncbi:MAG: twin-arginine translocation signal domain-containing protein [Gemmatimonadales bacterium]|nr:twin-arginine translocation signal domain-containing protein [Gemmatimonadales bacterium]MYG18101.1 twin-arginine translocation signal domain-containing protein [Gemmatimonadales bacterium]
MGRGPPARQFPTTAPILGRRTFLRGTRDGSRQNPERPRSGSCDGSGSTPTLHFRLGSPTSVRSVAMAESRRTFLKQSAATVAAVSLTGCAPEAAGGRPAETDGDGLSETTGAAPVPLPAETLRAVAEAVLPDELGDDGRERAVRAFERWSDALEPVAELSHPYLVPEIRYSGPDPRPGWAAQLEGLEKESGSRHGVTVSDLDVPARRELLARPLSESGSALGAPQNADHVALALMAHFFGSPVATDICYGRAIRKELCRTIEGAEDEPEPLRTAP